MPETILMARQGQLIEVPRKKWEHNLAQAAEHGKSRLSFMSEEHHRVRNWVVREMPRLGKPIPPEAISQALALPLERTQAILDDLEKHLFFLTRNRQGAVAWAYPVTAEPTPHRLTFNSGERLYAA